MTPRALTTDRLVLATATAVLVVGLVASALVATTASSPDRPDVDGATAADRYDDIEGIEAKRTTTVERDGTTASSRTYDVALRPGTDEKRLSLVDGDARYDLRVSNGSTLWLYDRRAANVTRLSVDGPSDAAAQRDRIARLFARLNETAGDESAADPPTVEPLPVVPETGLDPDTGTATGDHGHLRVSYNGTDAVGDREVHVLHLAPADANATYEQTLWVDAERYYPLKQRTAWTDDGERTVLTTTYEDVRFDPGIDDDAFAPSFPANASVHAPETPETTTYERVGDLEAAADAPVPDPEVPPSYELTYATRTEGQVHGVGLRYANDTSRLSVANYNFTYPADGGDEQVTVDGRQGRLTYGRTVTVSWNCESYRYTVRGQGVSPDVVVDVADSVGCPGADA